MRMEKKAAVPLFRGSVQCVSGDRVADAGQVHADLMSAAGADPDLQISEFVEAPQHLVLAPRSPAFIEARGHAGATHGIPRDRPLHPARVARNVPVDQSQVDLLYLAAGE